MKKLLAAAVKARQSGCKRVSAGVTDAPFILLLPPHLVISAKKLWFKIEHNSVQKVVNHFYKLVLTSCSNRINLLLACRRPLSRTIPQDSLKQGARRLRIPGMRFSDITINPSNPPNTGERNPQDPWKRFKALGWEVILPDWDWSRLGSPTPKRVVWEKRWFCSVCTLSRSWSKRLWRNWKRPWRRSLVISSSCR